MKHKNYFRLVTAFSLALAITTFLWFATPAKISQLHADGGYRVTRVGGAAVIPPGVTDVSDVVTSEGVFTEATSAASEDGNVVFTIDEGTIGLTVEGEPLSEISVTEMEDPPAQPADSSIIGLVYDFGPDGATFSPPITLTFTYDPALIPEGVSEENLVIAMWDGEKWVNLECIVDPVTHTITARIGHFTAFTILAYTHPAAFVASALTISPTEVDIGEEVTISVRVTNTGDLEGTYEVTLKIEDVAVATEEVTLAGGASQTVTFTTAKDVAGSYAVNVDGLVGTFVVKAPPVPPVPPAPPAPPVVPPAKINWWLIGGIIAAVIIAIAVPLTIRRRRRA